MKTTFVTIKKPIGLFLLSLVAGGSGYYWHALREDPVSILEARQMPGLEYFVTKMSFSEVDTAKAVLEASADRFIAELLARHRTTFFGPANGAASREGARTSALSVAIQELERGIQEFKGTPQELFLVKNLLWLLPKEGRHDRWLEVYLSALYQHPTDPLIGRFADKALHLGQAVGREEEVLKAFRHLNSIPLDFEVKHQVWAVVNNLNLASQNLPADAAHKL